MKIGILASHPIQYHAPWFRELSRKADLEVFYAARLVAEEQGVGFGSAFEWDIDLLSGYRHKFLRNEAARPSIHRFFGCDTPEIRNIVKYGRFDAFIVSGWNLRCYWQAVRACRRYKVPVLVRGDSQLLTSRSRLKRRVKEVIYPRLLRQFDGFLVVGRRNSEYLRYYGVSTGQMFFVPHCVNNEWFARQAEEIRNSKLPAYAQGSGVAGRSGIRTQWKIPEDAFCVLFCGKFIPKKRPMDLVKAVQLMTDNSITNNHLPTIHLLFAGSGELGAQLRERCCVVFDAESTQVSINKELITDNRKPRASFAGFLNQTEISKAYVAADCLVLPSGGGETWGLVVNEAMACGLPAIVSDAVGCAPDLIVEGETGFTFPFGNASALADRLAKLSQLRTNRFDFATRVRAKIRDFSPLIASNNTLAAVRSIADNN